MKSILLKNSSEQKIFRVILIFYWLALFAATHIPVPDWTRQMGMSDKTMHFIAYLVLTLLLWLGTSFELKADWKKFRPWLISAIVILYGAADEISQYFIHRSADILDFASNTLAVAAAMIIVSFVSSRHIVMVLFTICPLLAPGIVRSGLVEQNSILEYAGYITGFAIITIAWIKYLPSILKNKHLLFFFAPPAGTVLIVKIYAQLTGKPFGINMMLSAFAAIILTILLWRINIGLVKRVADKD